MEEAKHAQVAELLREQTGFDVRSVGVAAFDRAVRRRMAAYGACDEAEYCRDASTSPRELQELIETVVVAETWFFRHANSFAALADFVRRVWWPSHPDRVLRLLSLPCSSGEEPYSISMTLLDAGLPPALFAVDAVDISRRALAQAQRAVYRENSFRSRDLAFRRRYFTAVTGGYQPARAVREPVHFAHGNLLQPGPAVGAQRYDVVFCRNILIYFDAAAQQQAISQLRNLLCPDGLLFVGPAETALLNRCDFVAAPYAGAFGFIPASAPTETARMRERCSPPPLPVRPLPAQPLPAQPLPGAVTRRATRNVSAPAAPISVGTAAANDELEAAMRLADAGRLQEAAAVCLQYLRKEGNSAQAHYALGLIRDAQGDARAESSYRKALYLEPNHAEALLHLALLREKQGDAADAHRLRARARRVTERSSR